jgi:hypothetical protein
VAPGVEAIDLPAFVEALNTKVALVKGAQRP